MTKNIVSFMFLSVVLINCSISVRNKSHYISTLENIKFIISKKDSIRIDSIKIQNKAFYDTHEKFRGQMLPEDKTYNADFYRGISRFRELIFTKFILNRRSKNGENKIRITIGTKNNLEKIEILKYTDFTSRKNILKILRSKDIQKWTSASVNSIKVKYQFEFSLFIYDKN